MEGLQQIFRLFHNNFKIFFKLTVLWICVASLFNIQVNTLMQIILIILSMFWIGILKCDYWYYVYVHFKYFFFLDLDII